MKVERTGVILNTQNYQECVRFYRDILGLEVLFSKNGMDDALVCFDFGGCYLMVETGGHAKAGGKSTRESPAKLRLNVDRLETARQHLADHGIEAEISRFDWGSTINIVDPDGNRIGIREESEFSGQIEARG